MGYLKKADRELSTPYFAIIFPSSPQFSGLFEGFALLFSTPLSISKDRGTSLTLWEKEIFPSLNLKPLYLYTNVKK